MAYPAGTLPEISALALGVENRWSERFTGQIDETCTLPPLDVFLSVLSRLLSSKR